MSAHKALMKSRVRIDNHSVLIKAADSWHQPDSKDEENRIKNENKTDESKYPSKDETKTPESVIVAVASSSKTKANDFKCIHKGGLTLDQLNDDCLMEIFSKLKLYELCTVHCAAKRFQPLTEMIFRKNFNKMNWENTNMFECEEVTLHKLRSILMGCGKYIESLEINSEIFVSSQRVRALDLIIRMCKNIKSVSFEQFKTFDHSVDSYVNEFFARLESLTLIDSDLSGHLFDILGECNNLKQLNIGSYNTFNVSSLNRHYPYLVDVSIDLEDLNPINIDQFIKKNPQITSLTINDTRDDLMRTIADNLVNLNSLNLTLQYCQDTNVMTNIIVNQMKNLKQLTLKCNESSVSRLIDRLSKQNNLTHLYLYDVTSAKMLIDALQQFTNLQLLVIQFSDGGLDDQPLLEMGKKLINLNELRIQNSDSLTSNGLLKFLNETKSLNVLAIEESTINLNDEQYKKIADIYEKRKIQLKLFITQTDVFNVTAKCRSDNKQFIELNEVKETPGSESSSDDWNPYYDDFYDAIDDDDDDDMDDSDYEMYDLMQRDYVLW